MHLHSIIAISSKQILVTQPTMMCRWICDQFISITTVVVVALKCKQTIASCCVIKPHWDDSILYNDSKSKAESDFLSSYFASVFTCDDEYLVYPIFLQWHGDLYPQWYTYATDSFPCRINVLSLLKLHLPKATSPDKI